MSFTHHEDGTERGNHPGTQHVTLDLTAKEVQALEDALQRDAVNFLSNDGRQGISASVTLESEYYRANRALFSIVYDANPANK